MKYDKQKYRESKAAYERADNLSHWMEKVKENVGDAEGLLWCVCGLIAFVAFCFVGYGTAGDFYAFLYALVVAMVPLLPAITFSVVRRIVRSIMKTIVSGGYKTGQYYVKYENEIYDVKNHWAKAIDRLADIANSDNKNIKDEMVSLAKNMEKENILLDKKYDLSPEQEREVLKYITRSAEYSINRIKNLSEAQKKQFIQEMKQELYNR